MKRNTLAYISGSVIKQIRETADHKLALIEMKTGICASKLSKIESGKQLLDLETLWILCIYFDISLGAVIALVERKLHSLPHQSTQKRKRREG